MRVHERIMSYGGQSVKESELISLLLDLNEEKAKDIVNCGAYRIDKDMSAQFIVDAGEIPHLTPKRAAKLEAVSQMVKRYQAVEDETSYITCAGDVVPYFSYIRHEKQEHFAVAFLNVRNVVMSVKTVFVGDLSSTVVHPREVFRTAIEESAAGIILGHNHPSGDTTPSSQDIEMTRKLRDAGEILNIEVMDHIVISPTNWLSLKEAFCM